MYSYDGEGELHGYTAGRTEEARARAPASAPILDLEGPDGRRNATGSRRPRRVKTSRYYRAKGLSIMCFHYAIFDACVPEAREMRVHGAYTQADEY